MEDVQVAAWILVVPVKRTAIAKSRLAAAYPQHRPELARAFAADTISAALASPLVRAVLVVTDDPQVAADVAAAGARVVPDLPAADTQLGPDSPAAPAYLGPGQPVGGLNEALVHGAALAAAEFPGAGVAALSADLPALRTDELTAALTACVSDRSFVIDQPGTGTTLLAARPGVALDPRFGVGSALAHQASGAVPLDLPIPSVRRDVDTAADLADAVQLGVGPRTAEVLAIVFGAVAGSDGLAC
ncbi:2-phospho-L-lactate guanylyltransferase [Kribbella sp. ALI-6-A]|uniref:2-phospho-L-lactate guanylyltransferase n=1 Tax=Kribbella sp. ALI-6-A TaxID=1933817 RepID=UPI00097C5CE4|nr:2-phospho-L-lactate guanylyltransferase [Kribbella sp. ALI-6-A]ONI77601.1 2-phospho-L-lactate guanylyltransferase [Kribbella sp. ALI-6-A]